jgi:hypothetical protein
MAVLISEDVLQATRLTAEELGQDIAVLLFQPAKLPLAQSSRVAGDGTSQAMEGAQAVSFGICAGGWPAKGRCADLGG